MTGGSAIVVGCTSCPNPITKLAWDNAAILGPATAGESGIEHGNLVRLTYGGKQVEMPAYILPGQAAGSVAVALGYGRTAAGHVGGDDTEGVAAVGVNVYPLRTSRAMDFDTGLTIERTGKNYNLALTHNHHAIDKVGLETQGQRAGELVREATLAESQKIRRWPARGRSSRSWQKAKYEGHRWGMAIDLSKCIGCNACIVACQAENNIPMVGKERLPRPRDAMAADRPIFQGRAGEPRDVFPARGLPCIARTPPASRFARRRDGPQPRRAQRDGLQPLRGHALLLEQLSLQGAAIQLLQLRSEPASTRSPVLKMLSNPQVTVRSRGVMEKCTYCVQRINAAKIDAKSRIGRFRTARSSPPASGLPDAGHRLRRSERRGQRRRQGVRFQRAYRMLAELNVRPRTSYLVRIRNPNPELKS